MSFEGKTKMFPVVELTDGVGNLGFNQIPHKEANLAYIINNDLKEKRISLCGLSL